MGYKIIRIPYFIQLSTEVIKLLFDIDIDYEQNYNHGFIDKQALLPADFNSLGIDKFVNDMVKFSICRNQVYNTLIDKIEYFNNSSMVISDILLEKLIKTEIPIKNYQK